MKEAIQRMHDICSAQKSCTDCPLFNHNTDTLDEACMVGLSPYIWNVDKIVDILEKCSLKRGVN